MCVCEADIVLGSVTTQQWCACCVCSMCVCQRSPVQVGVFVCVLYVCVCATGPQFKLGCLCVYCMCVCVPQVPSSSWGVCVVYYAMCVQYRLQLSEAHKHTRRCYNHVVHQ